MPPAERRVVAWVESLDPAAPLQSAAGIRSSAVRQRLAELDSQVRGDNQRQAVLEAAFRYDSAANAARDEFERVAAAAVSESATARNADAPAAFADADATVAPSPRREASGQHEADGDLPELRGTPERLTPRSGSGEAPADESPAASRAPKPRQNAPGLLSAAALSKAAAAPPPSTEMTLADEIRQLWIASNRSKINAGNARRRQVEPLPADARAKAATAIAADLPRGSPRAGTVNSRKLPSLAHRPKANATPSPKAASRSRGLPSLNASPGGPRMR